MRLLRTMVLLNVMLVVGCGGSGGGGGGGDGPADEIDSVSEGLPTEEIDPEPVVMVAQPSTRVSGITYSWPEDFTVIEGDESFSLEEITTDFQRGRLIANPDDTVRCTDGVQWDRIWTRLLSTHRLYLTTMVGSSVSMTLVSAGFLGRKCFWRAPVLRAKTPPASLAITT